jgi:hypothetical protein
MLPQRGTKCSHKEAQKRSHKEAQNAQKDLSNTIFVPFALLCGLL